MNKKLTATLIATLLTIGSTIAQEQTSTVPAATSPSPAVETTTPAAATDSCCAAEKKGSCTMEKPCTKEMACEKWTKQKSCHEVLTFEERERLRAAEKAAIIANPSLAGKGHKKELRDAILKEDPSLKPLIEKLKKHREECKKWKKGAASPAS